MYGILLSALNAMLGFALRKVVAKALVFGALFFVVREFTQILIDHVFPTNGAGALDSGFAGLTPEMWYFLDLAAVPLGVPMVLSAYVTRFIVRRIPVIG